MHDFLKTWCYALAFSLILVACSAQNKQVPTSEIPPAPEIAALATDEIVFVTHLSRASYYLNGNNEWAGIDHDLAQLFVKQFAPEYKIRFVVAPQLNEIIPTLLKNQAHIATGLSITDLRKELILFATPFYDTQQQLIYNNENTKTYKPKRAAPLVSFIQDKNLSVPAGSSAIERLEKMQQAQPQLQWQASPTANADVLLEKVALGGLDLTIANSHLVDIMQNFHPQLSVASSLGEPEKMAWAFSKNADPKLIEKVNKFFKKIRNDGTLHNLIDRHYGHANRLSSDDINVFLARTDNLLPQYAPLFKAAQQQTGIDWRLLAALSYRESHWDTHNTSPTGVRGLMMLTENTANLMGVTDRLDPIQSVPAGAKYIAKLIDLIPENVPEPDRTYMALAAYNIGYAHLQDARALTKRLNLNPDNWVDVKKALLKLSDPDYYSTTKYGYASGGAPVVFVETVRSYQRILEHIQPGVDVSEQAIIAQNDAEITP
ncbi:MAG TPA: membrane-bound lytic murein transglycosylase MltF [Methylotenera sp.]|nr:membrane-bound lytic murein transglycosylase MltF [Methylotenera sp.]HPH04358.1 membrane-bound lytic murein transglycosylase MltF [Methylotenera sp.]HPM99912.1 membrane-bound lytic murein transglycosylase MltF [Methylotenera sp.]